jgi:hypothetical protein
MYVWQLNGIGHNDFMVMLWWCSAHIWWDIYIYMKRVITNITIISEISKYNGSQIGLVNLLGHLQPFNGLVNGKVYSESTGNHGFATNWKCML